MRGRDSTQENMEQTKIQEHKSYQRSVPLAAATASSRAASAAAKSCSRKCSCCCCCHHRCRHCCSAAAAPAAAPPPEPPPSASASGVSTFHLSKRSGLVEEELDGRLEEPRTRPNTQKEPAHRQKCSSEHKRVAVGGGMQVRRHRKKEAGRHKFRGRALSCVVQHMGVDAEAARVGMDAHGYVWMHYTWSHLRKHA